MTNMAANMSSKTLTTALLLDLGNTRLKVGYWNADHMQFLGAYPHQDSEALQQWLRSLLLQLPSAPVRAYGVTVASQDLIFSIESALKAQTPSTELQWVWPQAHSLGVTNTYPNPQQLGADRWAGMLGLMHRFETLDQSVVLANFGTATTVDTLSRDKHFLGGLILPGVSMMQSALSSGTARLPMAQGEIQDYPTNTHAAITTGIVAAQLGAIRRQIELSTARDGQPPRLCVSGGAWSLLSRDSHAMLPDIDILELPHIVLDGLCRVVIHAAHNGTTQSRYS